MSSTKHSNMEVDLKNTKSENTTQANTNGNSRNSLDSFSNIAVEYDEDEERESPADRVKFKGINDRDSICSDECEETKLPGIPDGGWGWVVVFAAFLVSACADGLAFSYGLLHEEFIRHFNETQSQTSLIGSLFIATPLIAGPIMSALVDRFGCRTMTMIAGIISTFGFLLAAISNSIGMLCLTFGIITGSAMGILYVTAIVSVSFWFDKRRNLAVSLASCGVGIGTFIYSPVTHKLLKLTDWRNTIVILACSLLNMCVCGALMRDPDWLRIKQKRKKRLSRTSSRRSSSAGSVSAKSMVVSVDMDAEELKSVLESGKSPEAILATLTKSIVEAQQLEATTQKNSDQSFRRVHSAIYFPTFVHRNENVPQEVINNLMENEDFTEIIHKYPEILNSQQPDTNKNICNDNPINIDSTKIYVKVKVQRTMSKTEESKPLDNNKGHNNVNSKTEDGIIESGVSGKNRQNGKSNQIENKINKVAPQQNNWLRQLTADHRCLRDMPLYRNTIMHRGAMMNIPRYRLRAASLPDMYKNSTWSLDEESDDEMNCIVRGWLSLLKTMNFKMFLQFHFFMFSLSALIQSVWFIVPYFYLLSYMSESHVDGGEVMIVIIGVASSIGIVALGWAGDQPWINVSKTYTICMIICGASVAAYPAFITSYWPLCIISALFGVSFASSYAYTPAILMELMPIDQFTAAYGMILLSQGLGHLIGPPIAGYLYDLTGAWDLTFYMAGSWLVVSGLSVGVIAFTKNFQMCGTKDPEETI